MIHQYHAQRFRGDPRRGVGTVPVGTVVYIQDGVRPLSGFRDRPICRNPWIVEAWKNREYYPCVKGAPDTKYLAGGHLATVRSLRDGHRQDVADWILLRCVDEGLTVEPYVTYSTVKKGELI